MPLDRPIFGPQGSLVRSGEPAVATVPPVPDAPPLPPAPFIPALGDFVLLTKGSIQDDPGKMLMSHACGRVVFKGHDYFILEDWKSDPEIISHGEFDHCFILHANAS